MNDQPATRNKPGRPKLAPGEEKKRTSYRLDRDLVAWMDSRPENNTALIEKALTNYRRYLHRTGQ